jgi:hypothetical protein
MDIGSTHLGQESQFRCPSTSGVVPRNMHRTNSIQRQHTFFEGAREGASGCGGMTSSDEILFSLITTFYGASWR